MSSNVHVGLCVVAAGLAIFSVIYGMQDVGGVYKECRTTFLIMTCLPMLSKISCTYYDDSNDRLASSTSPSWMMLLFIQTMLFIMSVVWISMWCVSCNHASGGFVCMVAAVILIFVDLLIFFARVLSLGDDDNDHPSGIVVITSNVAARRPVTRSTPQPPRDRDACRVAAIRALSNMHPCDEFCDFGLPHDIEGGYSAHAGRDSPPSKTSRHPDCSVCMETTSTAVEGCGHPLCTDCCTEYIHYHFARKSYFRCPVCRRKYDL